MGPIVGESGGAEGNSSSWATRCRSWGLPVCLALVATTLYLCMPSADSSLYEVAAFPNGARIQVESVADGKFVRVDRQSKRLLLTEARPWLHGSTFHVTKRNDNDECFQLKSAYGTWLGLDAESQELVAVAVNQNDATFFAAVDSSQDPYLSSSLELPNAPDAESGRRSLTGDGGGGGGGGGQNKKTSSSIKLKVCQKSLWFNVASAQNSLAFASGGHAANKQLTVKVGATAPTPTNFASILRWLGLGDDGDDGKEAASEAAISTNAVQSSPRASTQSDSVDLFSPAVFRVHGLAQWRGANLGGWFIPEVWMNPAFYNDTGLGWGGSLCSITQLNRTLAEARMRHVIETYITEEDFEEMAEMGFNSVRLPVGYWNLMKDPYHRYAPSDEKFSLAAIDWAFAMADKYGLVVLLDLHGAPGSQNGQDHSGCGMPTQFFDDGGVNVGLALKAIETMAVRYSSHPALLGFEVLNEPSYTYSQRNHSELVAFYSDAYRIIRRHSPDCIVVFNELYDIFYPLWSGDLLEPAFYNVVLDVHLYDWQSPFTKEPKAQHIRDAMHWKGVVEALSTERPVVVGEWCMSTGTWLQAGQAFVNAAVRSFDGSAGWFMWTWRVQRGIGFDEWDVSYQHEIHGLDPLQVYSKFA